MWRLFLKFLLFYFLWILILKPAYLSVRGKSEDSFETVKKVYWWMSPGKNGWSK